MIQFNKMIYISRDFLPQITISIVIKIVSESLEEFFLYILASEDFYQ